MKICMSRCVADSI